MLNRIAVTLVIVFSCGAVLAADPAELSGPDKYGRPGQGIEAIGDVDNRQSTPDMYGPEGAFLPFHQRGGRKNDMRDPRRAVNQVNRAMLALQADRTLVDPLPSPQVKPLPAETRAQSPIKPLPGTQEPIKPLPGTREPIKPMPLVTRDPSTSTGSSSAACDCSINATTKPCCNLRCLTNPIECAKEFGAPDVNLDVIKERMAKCNATTGVVWCAASSACIKIGDACKGMVEEVVNLIGGLKPGERCLAAAGFTWCAGLGKCVQQWKEACPASTVIGGLLPGQKCLGAAGYSWCEGLQKCVRTWEVKCPASNSTSDAVIGGRLPGEKCLGAAGYSWCESSQKCVRAWEEKCAPATVPTTPAPRSHTCLALIAGYTWCDALNACATEAECTKVTQEAIGGKLPGQRCLGAAGYTWCASKNKCLQTWIERCPAS